MPSERTILLTRLLTPVCSITTSELCERSHILSIPGVEATINGVMTVGGMNGSACTVGSTVVYSYRQMRNNGYASDVILQYGETQYRLTAFPNGGRWLGLEDVRLFCHNGRLMGLGTLHSKQGCMPHLLNFDTHDDTISCCIRHMQQDFRMSMRGWEKNWVTLQHDGNVFIVYELYPRTIIMSLNVQSAVISLKKNEACRVPFQYASHVLGNPPLRNGTNFVRLTDGRFLSFCHSVRVPKTYHTIACVLDASLSVVYIGKPFKLCRSPIEFASSLRVYDTKLELRVGLADKHTGVFIVDLHDKGYDRVAIVIPVHPPKFAFAERLSESFCKHADNLVDLFYVYTNDDEMDKMHRELCKCERIFSLTLDTSIDHGALRKHNTYPAFKKIWGVAQIMDRYEYVASFDAESLILDGEATLSSVIVDIGQRDRVYGCCTNRSIPLSINAAAKQFVESNLGVPTGTCNELIYFWFSDIPVYKSSRYRGMVTSLKWHEWSSLLTQTNGFEFTLYWYYCVAFHGAQIVDLQFIESECSLGWSLERASATMLSLLKKRGIYIHWISALSAAGAEVSPYSIMYHTDRNALGNGGVTVPSTRCPNCNYHRTWHISHCCNDCKNGRGHGPRCKHV